MLHQRTPQPIPPADLHALGRAVREVRARRAISQEELGFRAMLHRNYVGAIERGEINPTFRTLMTLADGLEVQLSSLVRLYELRRSAPVGSAHPPHEHAHGGCEGGRRRLTSSSR
jgi:transcriptional regulator with XRE-family HTH domain